MWGGQRLETAGEAYLTYHDVAIEGAFAHGLVWWGHVRADLGHDRGL